MNECAPASGSYNPGAFDFGTSPTAAVNDNMKPVQRPRFIPLVALALPFLLMIAGCVGQFFPSATSITALQVSPSNATVAPTVTQQYTVTATYANNTTADVTSSVTWSTSPTSVATITSGGLLTAVAMGTATVNAQSGSVIGSTGVTVATQTITSVSITPTAPQPLSLSAGPTTLQFTATATYSNGSMADVSATATWTSTPSSVATISSTGLVTAVSVGNAAVSATASGITSSAATVTVNP